MTRSRPRRRIEIGRLEVVLLMFGYVTSLAMVGIGGIYVGERSVQRRLGAKERILRLPVPSGTPTARDDAQEPNITFYDTLGQPEEPVREGRVIVPEKKTPAEPAARRAATQAPARERPAAPPDTRAMPPPAPAPVDTAARASPPEPRPAADREPGREVRQDDTGETARGAAPRELPSPPPGVTPEAAATARALLTAPPSGTVAPQAGTWSVQVNATQESQVARDLADRLRRRGYDAFVVTQVRDGATWYRVRVGRLPSLEMANTLVVQLKEREGLPHAFVASD